MKNLTPTFLSHVRSRSTTLAFCWKLTLRDGTSIGFTAHDQPLTIDGLVYRPETAIAPSAFQQDLTLSADDVEISALFDSDQISDEDLLSGKLDGAKFLYFLVNWNALPASLTAVPQDFLLLSSGQLGEYSATERDFTATGLSLVDKLSEKQSIQTSPVCRASLGDSKCGVNLTPFTHTRYVESVPSPYQVKPISLALPDGYFNNGELQITTGKNAGTRIKIAKWEAGVFYLFSPPFFSLDVTDVVVAIAGCDKRLATCRDKFSNVLNFRGEPSIPGQDVWTSGVPLDEEEDDSDP
jgi:uncharacterized phage protein (TIGR02218 family)